MQSKQSSPEIKDVDYPCYYLDSNRASLKAQKWYKGLIWGSLSLMFLSTILVSLPICLTKDIPDFEAINGWILFISCLVTIILTFQSPERRWYLGRAIAESMKTLSWRYMMHADPFLNVDDAQALNTFIERIEAINKQANKEKFIPKPNKVHLDIITKRMAEIRNLNLEERKSFYAAYRIDNQIKWYGAKSILNNIKSRICSGVIIVCQFLAAIYLFEFVDKVRFFNFNNILIFIATSAISIIELNKYKELFQSYALTKQELNIIRTKFGIINDDQSLNEFVLEAEQAISREHTMWLARRGTLEN